MGQSATLYRIDKEDFLKITDNIYESGVAEIEKGNVTFVKSFEGLRFILSKGKDKETTELIDKIFYPKTFIGNEIDFKSIDFDNLPEDFTFETRAIYYNDPDTVSVISSFLDTVSVEIFLDLFDHNELNNNDIYLGNVWNIETSDEYAFNKRHMAAEFKNLKELFSKTKFDGDYLFSFVG